MSWKVFIDGKEGTTGLKIFERFSERQDITLLQLSEENRKNIDSRIEKIKDADITFLCLPDEAAKEIAEKAPSDAKLIDTSTAHRTDSNWAYGFPELNETQRDKIKKANRVSVPGCHATGFISLVNPLIELEIAPKAYPFTCHSVTGYSGGGKKMISEYEDENRSIELKSPRQYGLTQRHKHLKEMTGIPKLEYAPIFSPIVADYFSGMVVTIQLHSRLLSKKLSAEEVCCKLKDYYKKEEFIEVKEIGKEPDTGFLGANNLEGKNFLEIYTFGHEDQIVLASRFDNLGKGASGAAVQCMNIMLGLPEYTGLK